MKLYRRSGKYVMDFTFQGKRIQRSTHLANKEEAKKYADKYHAELVNRGMGFIDREPAPKLNKFSQRFLDTVAIRKPDKPSTVNFYRVKMKPLLEFGPLAEARLNEIDENLIDRFVQHRSKQYRTSDIKQKEKKKGKASEGKRVSPATVNRSLATLRALLYMAHELGLIARVPKIRLLSGEGRREFVLSHQQEIQYLSATPQPLKDIALLIIDTGLRQGEALNLKWSDIFSYRENAGYLVVREGKTKNARRAVLLTQRVREMLLSRRTKASSVWVFPNDAGTNPVPGTSLDHQNAKLRKQLNLPDEFVIHSLRHTMLTRLGESGADAFTIMKIAGHSSITVSQRYVHPSQRAVEIAFKALEEHNQHSLSEAAKETLQKPLETQEGLSQLPVKLLTAGSKPKKHSRELSQVSGGTKLEGLDESTDPANGSKHLQCRANRAKFPLQDYESPALTVELQAHDLHYQSRTSQIVAPS